MGEAAQGITWEDTVSQVDEDSGMVPTCWLCAGRAHQRNIGLCQHFSLGESCLPSSLALILMPIKFFPVCLWCLSSCSPSVAAQMGMSPTKSVPFKRNCLGHLKPSVSLSHSAHWFLQPEDMGTSLPGTGTLGWRAWCGDATLAPQGGPLQLRYLSQFYLPHMSVEPACSVPTLHTSLSVAFALIP